MTFTELDQLVTDTCKGDTRVEYGVHKPAAEAGEVLNEYAEAIRHRKPVDPVKVMGELGDVLWCVAHIAQCLGYTAEHAAALVDAKLRARLLHGKQPKEEYEDACEMLKGRRSLRSRGLRELTRLTEEVGGYDKEFKVGAAHELPSAGMGKDGHMVVQPTPAKWPHVPGPDMGRETTTCSYCWGMSLVGEECPIRTAMEVKQPDEFEPCRGCGDPTRHRGLVDRWVERVGYKQTLVALCRAPACRKRFPSP